MKETEQQDHKQATNIDCFIIGACSSFWRTPTHRHTDTHPPYGTLKSSIPISIYQSQPLSALIDSLSKLRKPADGRCEVKRAFSVHRASEWLSYSTAFVHFSRALVLSLHRALYVSTERWRVAFSHVSGREMRTQWV